MTSPSIVLLGRDNTSTRMIYHAIKTDFQIKAVILEEPESKSLYLKRRLKKYGFSIVLGQIAFQIFRKTAVKWKSKGRIKEIKLKNSLNEDNVDHQAIIKVKNINQKEVEDHLKKLNPDVILINGTRIIKSNIIHATKAPLINMHVGITPLYRGVHGAYWALVNNDLENCGVSIYQVDEGIDTGGVLYQSTIQPTNKDTFDTYSLLQLVQGIPYIKQALKDAAEGELKHLPTVPGKSALWGHPTLWGYLYRWVVSGVK